MHDLWAAATRLIILRLRKIGLVLEKDKESSYSNDTDCCIIYDIINKPDEFIIAFEYDINDKPLVIVDSLSERGVIYDLEFELADINMINVVSEFVMSKLPK